MNNAPSKNRSWLVAIIITAGLICIAVAVLLLNPFKDNTLSEDELALATTPPAPRHTPFIPEDSLEETVESLKGATWVDRYDPAFVLVFDALPSVATETNTLLGASRTFTLTSLSDGLYLAEGQSLYRLWLSSGALYIDFGGTVGVVEYLLSQPTA